MRNLRTLVPVALAVALTVAAPAALHAQVRGGMGRGPAPRQQQAERAIRFYLLGGYSQIEVDELNARLASLPEPYTEVDDDMAVFGAGVHGRLGRGIVGLELSMMASLEDAEMADDRRAELTGFTGSVVLGYSLLQTYGFDFYPMIQLGGAAATLTVEERGDPAWDDVLADPGRSSMLNAATFYGAAGIGMDYTFRGGFFMGLRGTWGYTPATDDWSDETGDVLGGPEMDLSGPTVRLLVGFGGRN